MTQRYAQTRPDDEERLIGRMWSLAEKHPRYGYRRIWALLRREGWRFNRKRVYRLWRRKGLKVTRPRAAKRPRGSSENSCAVRTAEHPDHVWTWDFIHDRTLGSRPLKLLSLVDEYTRECVALEVSASITAQDAIAALRRQFLVRGAPGCIRVITVQSSLPRRSRAG
jgi:transposase InsO family protein